MNRWTIHCDGFGFIAFDFHGDALKAGEVEFSPKGHFHAEAVADAESAAVERRAPRADMRLSQKDQSYPAARGSIARAGW